MVESASVSLDEAMAEVRDQVDARLAQYVQQLDRGCPERLAEAMTYSLLAPGKRLRPLLVILAAEACGGDRQSALPAACAVEMVHAYSLVHDDLPAMDDDDLRRGRPTCHKAFDEGIAILTGDALLTLAFDVLSRDITPAESALTCVGLLAHAAGPMNLVGGQADDLAAEHLAGNIDILEAIHRRKTGAMISASLQLGAVVAGASDAQRDTLSIYGEALGLAFQITDDLLDVRGDGKALGKRVGKDQTRGKLTFPSVLGIDESERRARELTDRACAAVEPWGDRAGLLTALARRVLERNH